eukprot:11903158-Alexandrium_andersonii.AAC.1
MEAWSAVVGPYSCEEKVGEHGPEDTRPFASSAAFACHPGDSPGDLKEDRLASPRNVPERREGPQQQVRKVPFQSLAQ